MESNQAVGFGGIHGVPDLDALIRLGLNEANRGLGLGARSADSETVATEAAGRYLGDSPPIPPARDVMPETALYQADAGGVWLYAGSEYTPGQVEAWVAAEVEHCRRDPLYFVTRYCYAVNLHDEAMAAGVPPSVELIPDWPHIRALVDALFPARDVVIEKSRRMTASWVMMAAVLHDMIFQRHWPMMALSRVEPDVDDGGEKSTVKSLFGKLRFLWDGLPGFLRANPLEFRYLRVLNPASGTSITGYPSSHSPGRGGGFKRAILDEFAWVEHSQQVMASVAAACAIGKVLTSTPAGKANEFYRIRCSAFRAFPNPEPPRFATQYALYTIHWSLHPHRDQAWKQRLVESASMTEEAIAQEIEINYAKALGGRVYPKFNHEQHVVGGSQCTATADYDPRRPLNLTCDFNHDPLIFEITQTHYEQPPYRIIGEICRRNAIVDDAVFEFICRYGSRQAVNRLADQHAGFEDNYGKNGICVAGEDGHAQPVVIFGDATEEKSTVHNRVKTYQHMKALLQAAGFLVSLKVPEANPPRDHRFETMNDALARNLVVVAHECGELRKDCESGVWNKQQNDMDQNTEDGDGSGLTRSHASSALGYMLCILHKIATSAKPAQTRQRLQSVRSFIAANKRGW